MMNERTRVIRKEDRPHLENLYFKANHSPFISFWRDCCELHSWTGKGSVVLTSQCSSVINATVHPASENRFSLHSTVHKWEWSVPGRDTEKTLFW